MFNSIPPDNHGGPYSSSAITQPSVYGIPRAYARQKLSTDRDSKAKQSVLQWPYGIGSGYDILFRPL